MDHSRLLPTTFSLLLFIIINTFFHFSFAYSKDDGKPHFLPTEGTPTVFPFVNLLPASFNSNYEGDSFSLPENKELSSLLAIGSLNKTELYVKEDYIVSLDGMGPTDRTWNLEQYSMKFVAYDMRLGKLETVDALGMSFSVELHIFLQWQEWQINGTFSDNNTNCYYLCDSTRPMDNICCDRVWVPTLRLPNADVTQMDSILSYGNLGTYIPLFDEECMLNQTAGNVEGNASCYEQRFWELSVDAKCDANMNFKYFPFDVQELSIDIRNPFASRTWLQLAADSLKQRANNLVQRMAANGSTLGWSITDVIVSPLCDVLSWNTTFLGLDTYLFEKNASQAKDIETQLISKCPKLYNWSPEGSSVDLTSSEQYNNIRKAYFERLNYTQSAYVNCVKENGTTTYKRNRTDNYRKFWINTADSRFDNKVSLPCLVQATKNLTTPGIKVTILVKRYTEYYILKLVIPMIVCVGFAFTAVIIEVRNVADRLMVIVPAAIALTALQVTVVATDIPAVSDIVPTTYLMMLSYLIQLLISFESMVVYKWGYPYKTSEDNNTAEQKVHFKCAQFNWTTRRIDFFLMGMLFILYILIVSLCMFIPISKVQKNDLLSNGISIWNPTQ